MGEERHGGNVTQPRISGAAGPDTWAPLRPRVRTGARLLGGPRGRAAPRWSVTAPAAAAFPRESSSVTRRSPGLHGAGRRDCSPFPVSTRQPGPRVGCARPRPNARGLRSPFNPKLSPSTRDPSTRTLAEPQRPEPALSPCLLVTSSIHPQSSLSSGPSACQSGVGGTMGGISSGSVAPASPPACLPASSDP